MLIGSNAPKQGVVVIMLLKVSPDGKVSHCRELLRVQSLTGTCVLRHANVKVRRTQACLTGCCGFRVLG